jgi:nicotinate dehydrogenase subunit B
MGAALLHGALARPPQIDWHASPPRSARLLHVDADAVRAMPGIIDVVVRADFVGVIAVSAQSAAHGVARLGLRWSAPPPQKPTTGAPLPVAVLAERGDVDQAGAVTVEAAYRWPLAPPLDCNTWATARVDEEGLMVWAPVESAAGLRGDLAALLGLRLDQVRVACVEGEAACPEARHAAADAALLAQAAGRAVQVTLFPEQVRPGDGYLFTTQVRAVLGAERQLLSYAMTTGAMPPSAPPLALVLAGVASQVCELGGPLYCAVPPYAYPALRICATAATGAAPLADPSPAVAAAHVFAHESHMDALSLAAGVDPVAMRLAALDDERGRALVGKVAARAGWTGRSERRQQSGVASGRGFAYASVLDADAGHDTGHAAWVVDVAVDLSTGEVSIARVVVGHDAAGPEARLSVSSTLLEDDAHAEAIRLTTDTPVYDSWNLAAYTRLPGGAVTTPAPASEQQSPTVLRGAGIAMLPAAAAVANAIFDATGIRLREPPFSAARLRAALPAAGKKPSRAARGLLAGAGAAVVAALATVLPWRAPIAPVAPPPAGFYSAQTIERGRLVAAAGDCVVCHTAPNGAPNAGGLALDTPFGTIYSTNITPDPQSGIGAWSYAAFERAMRDGVHRDGRRLYPAFPYTAFAKVSDADMQSLYAYLMAQPAVAASPPETRLAFPFNMRLLMAGWNLLFHRNEPFRPDPAQTVEWNRGAYLAEGLGHCSACHSPRNALGAEQRGKAYFGGGQAEGWDAPALNALSAAPLPWTKDELYRYLRDGYAPLHGPAAGPMAPVVEGLAALPDSDVMAIATYVASFGPAVAPDTLAEKAAALEQRSQAVAATLTGAGADLFAGACAVCHQAGQGTAVFGEKVSLALNTNLHGPRPDNLVQVLMHGVATSASSQVGAMPAFADSLSDRQMTTLVDYLRQLYAPDKPAWTDVARTVERIRHSAD